MASTLNLCPGNAITMFSVALAFRIRISIRCPCFTRKGSPAPSLCWLIVAYLYPTSDPGFFGLLADWACIISTIGTNEGSQ